MENITKTFNSTAYTCTTYNRNSKAMDTSVVILNKDFDADAALKIISKKYGTTELIYIDVADKTPITEKRTMSVDTFMRYAVALEKPNPALVTRTVKRTDYTVVYYDRVLKVCNTAKMPLDKSFDDNAAALKALQKRYNGDTMTIVDILGKDTTETLYGISPDDFIKHSAIIDDSKEG